MPASPRPALPRVTDEPTRSALTQAHDQIDRLQATITSQGASITALQALTARITALERRVAQLDGLVRRLQGQV